MGKFKSFINKKWDYLIVTGVTIFLVLVAYLIMGAFPFGTKSLAHYDASAQIVPLTNLIFDFFEGKASLFYSQKLALGANTFGYLIYIFLSPFSFLFLIFGRGGIYYAFNIVYLLKLLVIGIVICFFIKKYFKDISTIYKIIFSLLYVFCGYGLVMLTWLPWLDFLIYMPLLYMAFEYLIKKGKILPLSAILVLFVYSSNVVGSFSFILIFLLLGAYVFFVTEKQDKNKIYSKLVLAFATAVAFALPIIVPQFMQIVTSSRGVGFFEAIFNNKLMFYVPIKLITIIADAIILIFALVYFIKCNKKEGINKFLFFAFIVLLITVLSDGVVYFLHGGSNYGYPLRFGFLNVFISLICALKYIQSKHQSYDETLVTHKKYILVDLSLFYGLIFIITIVFFVFALTTIGKLLSNNVTDVYVTLLYAFAIILNILPLIFLMISFKHKNIKIKFHKIFISITASMLIFFNVAMFIIPGFIQTTNVSNYKTMFAEYASDERVKDWNEQFSYNTALDLQMSSVGAFTSSLDKSVNKIFNNFNDKEFYNAVDGSSGTLFFDIIFANKYYFSKEELNRPYLQLLKQENNLYIYENKLAFKQAFLLDNLSLFKTEAKGLEYQNELYNFLGGEGNLFNWVSVFEENNGFEIDFVNLNFSISSEGKYVLKVIDSKKDAYLEIKYTATNDGILYFDLQKEESTDGFCFFEEKTNYAAKTRNFGDILDLGFASNGDIITQKISVLKEEQIEDIKLAILDYELLTDFIEDYNFGTVDFENLKNGFKIKTNSEIETKLVLSYINLDGYTATINGEKIKINEVFDGLMSLNLESGENEILIQFHNPYYKYVLISLLIGIVIATLALLLNKFYFKTIGKMEVVLGISYKIAIVGILAFFFLLPLVIEFLKLITVL